MQELQLDEIEQVDGGAQLTGFLYYMLSGGDIIFMDDTGAKTTFSF